MHAALTLDFDREIHSTAPVSRSADRTLREEAS